MRNQLTGVVSFYSAFGIETPKLRTCGKKARAKRLPENWVIRNSYLKTHDEEERKLTQNVVQKIYRAISQKAGLSTARGHWNTIRSHTMQKAFNTNLTMANCNANLIETMMGHPLGDVKEAYLIPDDEKFKDIYSQYTPFVTVQKQLDISTSPEYIDAVKRAERAESQAVRVSVERNEIYRLKAEIDELKNAN